MGPSVPNFTLIGDGGGHSSLRNSNICQSCAVLATFSPFSNNSRIYWSRWNMVRNQRLSIYSRRPFFLQSENGYGHGSPQTLQILSKCRAFGWFSPVRRQKKTNTDDIRRLPWVCCTVPKSALVADGDTQTPEFHSLVNVAVFRWDHRFPGAWE